MVDDTEEFFRRRRVELIEQLGSIQRELRDVNDRLRYQTLGKRNLEKQDREKKRFEFALKKKQEGWTLKKIGRALGLSGSGVALLLRRNLNPPHILSSRANMCLRNEGFEFPFDPQKIASTMTEWKFRRIPNVGRVTRQEIKEWLRANGHSLAAGN